MNKVINLISDTVTKPSEEMLHFMMKAKVGDDVFGQDPTINQLEKKVAEMFGMEAAIFCPSGTMTNQIAIKVHTQAMDEVICDKDSHIFHYENAGYAWHSGVGLNTIQGNHGKLTVELIEDAIRPLTDWYPRTSLVVLENSCNKAGGTHYTLKEMQEISQFCKYKGLKLHLDGARIFNVLVEEGFTTAQLGEIFDSISICLSKGLGAPVGSLLIGTHSDIAYARRLRKALGGGMRQAGYLAAAGIFALDHHIPQLKTDNTNAGKIRKTLSDCTFVENIRPGQTNIVIFDLKKGITADQFIEALKKKNILCSAFGKQTVRMVTHRHIQDEEIDYVLKVLLTFDRLSSPSYLGMD